MAEKSKSKGKRKGNRSMQSFYCDSGVWTTFERMAGESDRSIDDLINESMQQYAEREGYTIAAERKITRHCSDESTVTEELVLQHTPTSGHKGLKRKRSGPPTFSSTPTPHGRNYKDTWTPLPRSAKGKQPTSETQGDEHAKSQLDLFVEFGGQRVCVDKDQFIIGRMSKHSDLVIQDANVSRKHAALISRNGTFYIQDLGSTNGINYQGMRIDNKRIDEGDSFRICGHELTFSYESPE